MKEKLTLMIDRKAIAFAKRERTSLSKIVDRQFNQLGTQSFVEKWRGQFKEPKPDRSDPRLTYLLRKYVHNR
jgi:uncharacterized protein DUF6364